MNVQTFPNLTNCGGEFLLFKQCAAERTNLSDIKVPEHKNCVPFVRSSEVGSVL